MYTYSVSNIYRSLLPIEIIYCLLSNFTCCMSNFKLKGYLNKIKRPMHSIKILDIGVFEGINTGISMDIVTKFVHKMN